MVKTVSAGVDSSAMSNRQYLDATVTEITMKAFEEVARLRPENPVEYMATWILNNAPKK